MSTKNGIEMIVDEGIKGIVVDLVRNVIRTVNYYVKSNVRGYGIEYCF